MYAKKILLSVFLISAISSACYAENYTVSNNKSSGNGSLSAAVIAVNALAGGTGHTITFSKTVKKIAVDKELTITGNVTIYGNGATLEGSGTSRIIGVTSGHVVFDSLTFTGGHATGGSGGAVKIEGADASAEFRNCTFHDNQAEEYGGAVCVVNGSVNPRTTLTHCSISGNIALTGGGFAIRNGEAAVYASVITGNTGNNDVYKGEGALMSGEYNIIGTQNIALGGNNESGVSAGDVFLTGSLEEEDGVNVLKLSGTSRARDFIPSESNIALDKDETGRARPQLSGYDAGAYETPPVPVKSVVVYGKPYMQINGEDTCETGITPEDASIGSITWKTSNSSVVTIDDSGKIKAVGIGEATITADVQGWTSGGASRTYSSEEALPIHVGNEKQGSLTAKLEQMGDVNMAMKTHATIEPEVSITMNTYEVRHARGGVDYELSVETDSSDIVTAEVVSGNKITLLAGEKEGTCNVTITASPRTEDSTEGNSDNIHVKVTVSGTEQEEVVSGDLLGGHHGGGCNSGALGAFVMLVLSTLIIHKRG